MAYWNVRGVGGKALHQKKSTSTQKNTAEANLIAPKLVEISRFKFNRTQIFADHHRSLFSFWFIMIICIHPAQEAISYTIQLGPLTLPLSPANGGEGGGEGEGLYNQVIY
jgi:hypothetical protein